MSEEKTPGQAAYEARQVAKGRRMGADDDTPDSEILAVIALGWDELPPGMQADEEAGAQAVLGNRTPWGDASIVAIAMGSRCVVVRSGLDGEVVKVISYGDTGLCYYDSVEEWQRADESAEADEELHDGSEGIDHAVAAWTGHGPGCGCEDCEGMRLDAAATPEADL